MTYYALLWRLMDQWLSNLADAGVEHLELLVLRGHAGGGGLSGKHVHEARHEAVDGADNLAVGAVHARRYRLLERPERRKHLWQRYKMKGQLTS